MELIFADFATAISICEEQLGEKYYLFSLPYVATYDRFREIDRFLWESRHMYARFQNRYSGPVVVDVTEWCREEPNVYLEAFLFFLKDLEEKQPCILISEKLWDKPLIDTIRNFFTVEFF